MDRPHSRYSSTTRPPAADPYESRRTGGHTAVEPDYRSSYGESHRDRYRDDHRDEYETGHDDDYDAYDEDIREYYEPIDRRWIWVAAVAGAILLIAVICTVVILGGGDSGAVSKTVIPSTPATSLPTSAGPSVVAAPPPAVIAPPPVVAGAPPALSPGVPLSPETVTTLAPSPTASAAPAPGPVIPAPIGAAPSPRNVTYQVTGSRTLIDLVTVVYTDQQGALQTDFNVALPWTRTVTLDPGVQLSSVTATSLTGKLNCAIIDANGVPIVAHDDNTLIATCTK